MNQKEIRGEGKRVSLSLYWQALHGWPPGKGERASPSPGIGRSHLPEPELT